MNLERLITTKTIVAGVIGYPLEYSSSPLIHNYWLSSLGIDGVYLPFRVEPARLEEAVTGLAVVGVRGFNVTLCHKETIIPMLTHLTPDARRCGAVNTVVVADDRQLIGHNTDAFGFREHLVGSYPDRDFCGETVAILGAGGAARAVARALVDLGVKELRIIARSLTRARAICELFGIDSGEVDRLTESSSGVERSLVQKISVWSWSAMTSALKGVQLLVNTTPLGMKGQGELVISLASLPRGALVADVVYVPLVTPLLRQAENHGHPTLDGLGMLLHQARPGFQMWFGRMPAVDASLRNRVAASLA